MLCKTSFVETCYTIQRARTGEIQFLKAEAGRVKTRRGPVEAQACKPQPSILRLGAPSHPRWQYCLGSTPVGGWHPGQPKPANGFQVPTLRMPQLKA